MAEETPRERRLRQKRESEARRRAKRGDEIRESKRKRAAAHRGEEARRQREWRAANPDKKAEQQRRQRAASPEKTRARKLASVVPLGPCEVCGTTVDVHRHHPDHSKPLEVVLLCRTHHAEAHRVAA